MAIEEAPAPARQHDQRLEKMSEKLSLGTGYLIKDRIIQVSDTTYAAQKVSHRLKMSNNIDVFDFQPNASTRKPVQNTTINRSKINPPERHTPKNPMQTLKHPVISQIFRSSTKSKEAGSCARNCDDC